VQTKEGILKREKRKERTKRQRDRKTSTTAERERGGKREREKEKGKERKKEEGKKEAEGQRKRVEEEKEKERNSVCVYICGSNPKKQCNCSPHAVSAAEPIYMPCNGRGLERRCGQRCRGAGRVANGV